MTARPRDKPQNQQQTLLEKTLAGMTPHTLTFNPEGTIKTQNGEEKPLYNIYLRKTGKQMIMVIYFVEQIEDQHSNFGFKNVPRIYKTRVREMLIAHGNAELADDSVNNYVGPRPPLVLADLLAAAEEKYLKENDAENNGSSTSGSN